MAMARMNAQTVLREGMRKGDEEGKGKKRKSLLVENSLEPEHYQSPTYYARVKQLMGEGINEDHPAVAGPKKELDEATNEDSKASARKKLIIGAGIAAKEMLQNEILDIEGNKKVSTAEKERLFDAVHVKEQDLISAVVSRYAPVSDGAPMRTKWNKENEFEEDPGCWGRAAPCVKYYIRFTNMFMFWEIAYGKYSGYFDTFIIGVIILAGAMVGIQTYPVYSCPSPQLIEHAKDLYGDDWEDWAEHVIAGGRFEHRARFCEKHADPYLSGDGYIDMCILWVFVAEVLIKIFANGAGPWNYWVGPEWRWNNFDFIIVALGFEDIGAVLGNPPIMVLRLFRLARLLKLVGKIKKLQAIISGMVAGIKASGYIGLLLFLVYYIFAIAGMLFFEANDPFHFRSIPIAILSLWRAATLEDWTDIMYISIYGCEKYPSGIYYVKKDYFEGGKPKDGMFDDDPFYDSWSDVPNYFRCAHPKPQPATAGAYWILFTFISSFVMLSLFVGAVTIAMSESMDGDPEVLSVDECIARNALLAKKAHDFKAQLTHGWNMYAKDMNEKIIEQDKVIVIYKLGAWSRFAEKCKDTAENPYFSTMVTLTIIAAGITVGIDTELMPAVDYDDKEVEDLAMHKPMWYVDTIINWVFTVEVLLKLLGEDWHPWTFFNDGWNQFDFLIVASSWLPVFLAGLPGLGSLKLLRLLRLFRLTRVIKSLPQLAVIVDALITGFQSIGFIAIILFVVFYLFAILGMMLFKKNDPFHFGTLHRALLSLFRVCTFEDWTDVMYINLYSCSEWAYSGDDTAGAKPANCNKHFNPSGVSPVFFVIFVFIGALVLLTLFVGVVTTSMENAQGAKDDEINAEKLKRDYCFEDLKDAEGNRIMPPKKSTEVKIPVKCCAPFLRAFDIVKPPDISRVTLVDLEIILKAAGGVHKSGGSFEGAGQAAFEGTKVMLTEMQYSKIDLTDIEASIDNYEFMIFFMNFLARRAGSDKVFPWVEDPADMPKTKKLPRPTNDELKLYGPQKLPAHGPQTISAEADL